MDFFEVNKLLGAFLGVMFVVFSIYLISGAIFAPHLPETAGFTIAAPEGGEAAEPVPAPAAVPIATLLASADATAGEAVFKKCAACHTGEKGGANKVGPNLWGIVNRPIASHEGFAYSGPMKEFSQGGSVVWDYEHLDEFLISPKADVKGTAMGFAGLKKDDERANLIAYLRTLADSPAPLPEAAPAAEGASAPAEGAAPAAAGRQQRPPKGGPCSRAAAGAGRTMTKM